MANIINIRLTKDYLEVSTMDETAKALGISGNEMIVRAITMMMNLTLHSKRNWKNIVKV
ncbi:hypothetical protein [Alkaliphilus transvaalensis]|uniref:hypothetical protein n=1 Tax=Alkaliphilus transvaalensis TaxID=114628 RepID=UPI0012EB10F1|nr:hypothetical protein [Alkaliphilus transvaalensis]